MRSKYRTLDVQFPDYMNMSNGYRPLTVQWPDYMNTKGEFRPLEVHWPAYMEDSNRKIKKQTCSCDYNFNRQFGSGIDIGGLPEPSSTSTAASTNSSVSNTPTASSVSSPVQSRNSVASSEDSVINNSAFVDALDQSVILNESVLEPEIEVNETMFKQSGIHHPAGVIITGSTEPKRTIDLVSSEKEKEKEVEQGSESTIPTLPAEQVAIEEVPESSTNEPEEPAQQVEETVAQIKARNKFNDTYQSHPYILINKETGQMYSFNKEPYGLLFNKIRQVDTQFVDIPGDPKKIREASEKRQKLEGQRYEIKYYTDIDIRTIEDKTKKIINLTSKRVDELIN